MVERLVLLAGDRGLDGEAMARAAGIDPRALRDPDGRIEVSKSDDLIEAIAARVGIGGLGAALSAIRSPTTYDVAGFVLVASRSLRAGLERAFRCQALGGAGERFTLAGDAVVFDPGTPPRLAHRVVAECALLEVLAAARFFSGPDTAPLAVSFTHRAEEDEGLELRRTFAITPTFGARSNAILLAAPTLASPPPGGAWAAVAAAIHAPEAEEPRSQWVSIARALEPAILAGDATLVSVARTLSQSPRTLQRRLAEEGETFERALDRVREHLARSLLAKHVPIREVATLLGYADKAGFYRAFRRWTGATPRSAELKG